MHQPDNADCRSDADKWLETKGAKPSSRVGAILIVSLWLAVGSALGFWLMAPRL